MSHPCPRARRAPAGPASLVDALRYFLTPPLWKQVRAALPGRKASRWQAQPLVFVLLAMTWCTGDSAPERFETARAFYVATHPRRRRPGATCAGSHRALARVPARALRVAAAAVRGRLAQARGRALGVDGFLPFGCDGSRVACPRGAELERRLPSGSTGEATPQVWVTALVHLGTGLLWAWRLGKGDADERQRLRQLLAALPPRALLVADAACPAYDVLRALNGAGRAFLIRLPSRAPLYVPDKPALKKYREGPVYYRPAREQRKGRPPIPVRLVRLRRRDADVCLITNVLDERRLPRKAAGKFSRWRWRNGGLFRTYKGALKKVKLCSRTVAQVRRELEGSLLAVQLLLAQGALALHRAGEADVLPSPRQVLAAIRAEVRDITGAYLGPRQRRTYWQRLEQARRDSERRKDKARRPWPGRLPPRPPRPPKTLKMGTDLKELVEQTLYGL